MTPSQPSSPPPSRLIPFDPDSLIFIIPLALLIAVGGAWGWIWLWLPAGLISAGVLCFFRDPSRPVPTEAGAIVSPADGKVVVIEPNTDPERGPVPGTRVIIFLSVLNCHINRAPCAGIVEKIRYQKGKFLNALAPESSDQNECNWIFLKCGEDRVTVRQIAGLIARRIVCRVREGQTLARGERIGLIRFGSRTELYLPAKAEIRAQVGQTVRGARDVIAVLKA
ncbi:phosphatidylserine decarboxylase family protein [Candidatus Sumerlaeota bacterium]|nr:phosphatidylserine decarboxylase family protein [Candidatus Sumerlaeota bacterium]